MTEPDPEVLAAIRLALAGRGEDQQLCAIHFAAGAVAEALKRVWESSRGTPAARFLGAAQAAAEELDRLALGVADGERAGPEGTGPQESGKKGGQ